MHEAAFPFVDLASIAPLWPTCLRPRSLFFVVPRITFPIDQYQLPNGPHTFLSNCSVGFGITAWQSAEDV